MLQVTENDIIGRLDKVFSSYDTAINLLQNNKFEDAFINLNTVRLINSEIITVISDYSNLNKQREFKDSNLYMDRSKDKIITKSIQKKIEYSENKIFNILKEVQEKNVNANIKNSILARFYIERYMPLAWNKNRDILLLANLSSSALLKELINFKQKNIIVLNQGCEEVNNFINNNQSNSILILVNSFKEIKVRECFAASSKEFFSNCLHTILYNFPNKLSINFLDQDAKNIDQFLNGHTYESNSFHRLSHEWVKNGLKNLKDITSFQNIKDLKYKFLHKSVIIVCPGPSLEKDISYLKKLNGKIYICAVGHALLALKKNNIIPDILIHIDPYECDWTEEVYDQYDFSKINLLLLGATCNNKLFKKPAKKIGWLLVNHIYDEWITDLLDIENDLENSLNVSHVSLIVLSGLGFKNIAFLGLDHAFEGNNVYADSVGDTKVNDWRKGAYIKWPSKNNGTVTTNKLFISSILAFERMIINIKKKNLNLNLYNCSSTGAKINGFKNTELKNFSNKHDSKKINITKGATDNIYEDNSSNKENTFKTNSYLSNLYKDLNLLYITSNRLLKIYKNKDFNEKEIKELQEANNIIIKHIKNNKVLSLTVQKYLQDYNQRKIMIYHYETDMQMQKKLYKNLNNLFFQFKFYVNNLINNKES